MSDALLGRWLSTLLTATETIECIDHVTGSGVWQVVIRRLQKEDRGSRMRSGRQGDRGREIVTCRPFVG